MKTTYNNIKKGILSLTVALALGTVSTLSAANSPASGFDLASVEEETMVIENWMTDLNTWTSAFEAEIFSLENEKEVELENWMMDANENNWNSVLTVDQEQELPLENWMLDTEEWK